ncbi:MAG: hypothetical protein AAF449_19910 [Myxococcota bacterium]
MARSKKKKDASAKATNNDPLQPGVAAFESGDYALARRLLSARADDPELSESQRQQARDMIDATRLERGTLLVGLACVALFLFAVVFTALKQP